MLELYFVFYRIPKMMSRLAKERNRSAVAWSIFGILAWFGAELVVFVLVGLGYGIAAAVLGWNVEGEVPSGLVLVSYLVALGAAIGAVMIVRKILSSRAIETYEPLPPPPPTFSQG